MRDSTDDSAKDAVPIRPGARRTARELARMVDRVTRDLPFGSEPADYLVVRDRLAERGPETGR